MKILGDTHLGRRFMNNVPLHRRGEREAMVREQFIRELDPKGAELHVMMGDLFDSSVVSLDTIMFAASAYKKVARTNQDTLFVILRGNHDKGRDLTITTAFDVFTALMSRDVNVVIVDTQYKYQDYLFLGWSPERSAEDVLKDADLRGRISTAFGHWDVDLRSPSHNLIPTAALAAAGITKAYTGHVHKADAFERDGVDVTVVGSMTGFAHGEGNPYVTLTLDELAETDVANLCVRVRLKEGEVVNEIPNCLQWQVEKYVETEEVELDVGLGEFDMNKVYAEVFEGRDITPPVKQEIDTKWRTTFTRPD